MDCWSEEHSLESWRAYNYPHVTAVYWSLYRLGRYHQPPLVQLHNWSWYLTRAHATAVALWTRGGDPWTKKQGGGVGTAQWGVMVGSVFELLLTDLWREGWEREARALHGSMGRADAAHNFRVGFSVPSLAPYVANLRAHGEAFYSDSGGRIRMQTPSGYVLELFEAAKPAAAPGRGGGPHLRGADRTVAAEAAIAAAVHE